MFVPTCAPIHTIKNTIRLKKSLNPAEAMYLPSISHLILEMQQTKALSVFLHSSGRHYMISAVEHVTDLSHFRFFLFNQCIFFLRPLFAFTFCIYTFPTGDGSSSGMPSPSCQNTNQLLFKTKRGSYLSRLLNQGYWISLRVCVVTFIHSVCNHLPTVISLKTPLNLQRPDHLTELKVAFVSPS